MPKMSLIQRMARAKVPQAHMHEVLRLQNKIKDMQATIDEYLAIIDRLATEREELSYRITELQTEIDGLLALQSL